MKAEHLEFLVEERSMEAFLQELLPRLLGADTTFQIHPHQGKRDLLAKLSDRLRGYAGWLPQEWRVLVVVDCDDEACAALKNKLEDEARATGLATRSSAGPSSWRIVNRIAIEELEAWYFGDWSAVGRAYPRVSKRIPKKARYRRPDDISSGSWEAFERILQQAGYFATGLRKIDAAQKMGREIDWSKNTSPSFRMFRDAVLEAVRDSGARVR